MVGILIVSHSTEIAEGTKKLAEQMLQKNIPLEAVSGTEDGRLGTDANLISKALEKMDKKDGVIVLADLGSAIMNVEMAFDLLSEDLSEKIRIANAPLVEGAVVGAVESSIGKNIEEILKVIESKDILRKDNNTFKE